MVVEFMTLYKLKIPAGTKKCKDVTWKEFSVFYDIKKVVGGRNPPSFVIL